jgi:colanic acid/amylovoran biosynthesis glycosyltransferase
VKVAFLVGVFPKLSETFILNQITGLIDRGHDVTILAMEPGENEHHDDVTRYGLLSRTEYRDPLSNSLARRLTNAAVEWERWGRISPRRGAMSIALSFPFSSPRLSLLMTSKMLRGRTFDIVHCHFGFMGKMAAAIAAMHLFECPLVTSYHGIDLAFGLRMEQYAQLHRLGSLFTVNSQFSWGRAVELGCPEGRLALLPVGLRPDYFAFAERSLGGDGIVRILSVARLVRSKGLNIVIEAVHSLKNAGLKIMYDIVGDGPMRRELEGQVGRCGLHNVVKFHGALVQREVKRRFEEAHLFVLPSIPSDDGLEGQGFDLQEAQSMGLPDIGSEWAGIPEGMLDCESGYLFPAGDTSALADRICRLAANHREWPQMGRAGRRFVEAKYDIERLNDRLVDLYASVCAKHPVCRVGKSAHLFVI